VESVYRYDLAPGTDTEHCFRNIRRRLEVELGDGCSVSISLQVH